jgi:2-keto-4-pentenoate hydratase
MDVAAAIDLIEAARGAGRLLDALPPGIAPVTQAEAMALQRALAASRGHLPPAGFKIGATGSRMQAYLGLSEPAAGYMSAVSASGATFSGVVRPGAECELAVRLSRDLPCGPCSRDQASEAVGAVAAAIELVENRYIDFATIGAPTLIADQFFHRAAVIGEPVADWRALDLPALHGTLRVDGIEADSGYGRELLGHPINSLAWLAGREFTTAFGGLRAGQWIMLGSVAPPVWLDRPCVVEVAFPPLPQCKWFLPRWLD